MLFSTQSHGCISSNVSSPSRPAIHYNSIKHSYSVLSPSTPTICIDANFVTIANMATKRTETFQENSLPSPPLQRRSRRFSGSKARSPKPGTSRSVIAQLRAELRHSSARLDGNGGFEFRSSQHEEDSDEESKKLRGFSPIPGPPDRAAHELTNTSRIDVLSTVVSTVAWDNDEDVFGTITPRNRQSNAASNSARFSEDELAGQLGLVGLSPTNDSFSHPPSSLPNLPHSYSSHTKALDVPQKADPRRLFGEDTHLPWVKRLSPTRFTQSVTERYTQRMNPRNSPPEVKSFWDAEDAEFDRWPSAEQAKEELDTLLRNATMKRSTFIKPDEQEMTIAEQIADAVRTPMGRTRTAEEQEQLILQLEDMDCGNPWGRDAHDDIIAPLFSHAYAMLPASVPARRMHVLDSEAYVSSKDPVVKTARPRLCDAVATILAYTSLECLEAFLDPNVEVFEWRRLGNCVMIHRQGNQVFVGNYYNFGTTYQWGYLVRSIINPDGSWSEVYGSVAQGTTPVTQERVLFEEFEAEHSGYEIEPENEEFALYVGRELANFLLRWSVWDYGKWWRYKVEWEADGVVTNAREQNRYVPGLLQG